MNRSRSRLRGPASPGRLVLLALLAVLAPESIRAAALTSNADTDGSTMLTLSRGTFAMGCEAGHPDEQLKDVAQRWRSRAEE